MFAISMLNSTGNSIFVAKFWKLLSCFKNREKKRKREEHCNCNVIRIFSDTAHVLRTCAHAIRSTATAALLFELHQITRHVCSCQGRFKTDGANSNSVKRTEIGHAGATIKPVVDFANIKP